MVSKLDYVPNLPWDIPGWIWDMITFGTSIYPKSEVRFGMYEIRIPVWDIPKLIWDISSVWATTGPYDIKNNVMHKALMSIQFGVPYLYNHCDIKCTVTWKFSFLR